MRMDLADLRLFLMAALLLADELHEARLALQELLGRYALAVDDHDVEALGACFTRDGVFGSAGGALATRRGAEGEGFAPGRREGGRGGRDMAKRTSDGQGC